VFHIRIRGIDIRLVDGVKLRVSMVKGFLRFLFIAAFFASVVGSFLTGMAFRVSLLNIVGVETTYKATSVVGRLFIELFKL
jgi:hypothetical protein